MDGIAEGCTINGEGVCEFGVVAEDGTEITLRVQAYFVPSLGSGNHLLSPQGIKTTDGNYEVGHQPCNVDDPSVTGKILIKPNVPGWDGFDVMPVHVIEVAGLVSNSTVAISCFDPLRRQQAVSRA